jgi:hypothetical protein
MTPEWVDALAHSNIVKQLHDIANGGRREKAQWASLIVNGILLLSLIGVGIVLHGDIEDVRQDLERSHPTLQPQSQHDHGDTVVVNQGGQSQGQGGGT